MELGFHLKILHSCLDYNHQMLSIDSLVSTYSLEKHGVHDYVCILSFKQESKPVKHVQKP